MPGCLDWHGGAGFMNCGCLTEVTALACAARQWTKPRWLNSEIDPMKFAHFSHVWGKPGMTRTSATRSCGASSSCATSSASTSASASSITSGPTKAGCRRPRSTRSPAARGPSGCGSAPWAMSCRCIIRCGSPRRSPSSTRCWAAASSAASCPASARLLHAVRHRLQFPQVADLRVRRTTCARPMATSSRSPSMATTTRPTARCSRCSRCRSRIRRSG